MVFPLRAPRLNNNDDSVRVGRLLVAVGQKVQKGDSVIEIETDKALYVVEAETEGFVLGSLYEPEDEVPIGTVLVWLGSGPEDQVPAGRDLSAQSGDCAGQAPEITAKARLLLDRYGIDIDRVPHRQSRITVSDVEDYLANMDAAAVQRTHPVSAAPEELPIRGTLEGLSPEERGMLRTVLWQRDHAVPGYVELQYDPESWNSYAQSHMKENRLLMPALLPLMAHRLVNLACETPKINATLSGKQRHVYTQVNLGFTVQSGPSLYLVVVRDAGKLGEKDFVNSLLQLQRKAASKSLKPEEAEGATIAFSSMARWNVSRHIPLLPPYCSLMIGHATPKGGPAVLGATYDHRVLSGYDVVIVLEKLAAPPR